MSDMNDKKDSSEIEIPEDSVWFKYFDFACIVPGIGVYIPFISTRDVLTERGIRAMFTGTFDKETYLN